MMGTENIDSIREAVNAAESGADQIQIAEEHIQDETGADSVTINVSSDRTSVHLHYNHE